MMAVLRITVASQYIDKYWDRSNKLGDSYFCSVLRQDYCFTVAGAFRTYRAVLRTFCAAIGLIRLTEFFK